MLCVLVQIYTHWLWIWHQYKSSVNLSLKPALHTGWWPIVLWNAFIVSRISSSGIVLGTDRNNPFYSTLVQKIFRNKCCIEILVIVSFLYGGINVKHPVLIITVFTDHLNSWFALIFEVSVFGLAPPPSLVKTYPTCLVFKKFKEWICWYANKLTMFCGFYVEKNNSICLHLTYISFYPWLVRLKWAEKNKIMDANKRGNK